MLIRPTVATVALCISQFTRTVVSVETLLHWCTKSDAFYVNQTELKRAGSGERWQQKILRSIQEKFLEWMCQIKKKLCV